MPDTRSGSERCGQPDQTADEIRTIVADRAFLRLCPENGPEWSESAAQWAQQEADAIANAVYQSLDFDVAPASPGDEGQRQDSLVEQLRDLERLAVEHGMYDAADFIGKTIKDTPR